MAARFLVSHPCEDACCEVMTDKVVEGAPVYRCPGCDSEWIELRERTAARQRATQPSPDGAEMVEDEVSPQLTGGG